RSGRSARRKPRAPPRDRPRRAHVSHPGTRNRPARAPAASSAHDLGIQATLRERTLQVHRAWRLDAVRLHRRVGEDLRDATRRDEPAAVDHDDAVAYVSEQVGLVLGDEETGPGRRQETEGLPDEPCPFGIQLRCRFVEEEVRRPQGQERSEHHELPLTTREPPRRTFGELLDPERGERRLGPLDGLASGQSEVHRPQGDLLEDRAGNARQLRRWVLESDPDLRGELMERPPRCRAVIDLDAARRQLATDGPRRESRGDEAERRFARLIGTDDRHDLAGPELPRHLAESGRRKTRAAGDAASERRKPGIAVGDASEAEHQPTTGSGTPATRRTTAPRSTRTRTARSRRSRPESGMDHRRCRRPGRLNARDSSARLRSSTSVSEVMTAGPTSGRTPRTRARTPPSVSSPRARWLSAIVAARSTSVGTASIVARATNVKRGGTPRRSRSKTNARASVVRRNRPIESEIARSRTSVWAAKSTPSRVA